MDLEIARTNMLKQQLRTSGVVNQQLLDLFEHLPREEFVPQSFRNFAYTDVNISLSHEQVMFSPIQEAQILQETAIKPYDRVLEIGTGTGYFTALLARQAAHVTSVEIFPEFTQEAEIKLRRHGVSNVSLHTGNGAMGWGTEEFDVIIVSGALQFLPESLVAQLAPLGRMFAVLGESPAMAACLIKRPSESGLTTRVLFETALPMLLDAPRREYFNF
ncbi:MAG: protein-L-isoaspartate O-methyltransferase [Legionellales bacterium]|nr:protein-L-isoaspartate O-methyltransferase [Legionellales bacterium]